MFLLLCFFATVPQFCNGRVWLASKPSCHVQFTHLFAAGLQGSEASLITSIFTTQCSKLMHKLALNIVRFTKQNLATVRSNYCMVVIVLQIIFKFDVKKFFFSLSLIFFLFSFERLFSSFQFILQDLLRKQKVVTQSCEVHTHSKYLDL